MGWGGYFEYKALHPQQGPGGARGLLAPAWALQGEEETPEGQSDGRGCSSPSREAPPAAAG